MYDLPWTCRCTCRWHISLFPILSTYQCQMLHVCVCWRTDGAIGAETVDKTICLPLVRLIPVCTYRRRPSLRVALLLAHPANGLSGRRRGRRRGPPPTRGTTSMIYSSPVMMTKPRIQRSMFVHANARWREEPSKSLLTSWPLTNWWEIATSLFISCVSVKLRETWILSKDVQLHFVHCMQ